MFNKFDFLGKTVSMYSIIAIAGMLIAGFFICRAIKRRGNDDTDAVIVLCFATLGAFIGSHLLYALTNFRYFHEYLNVNSFSEFAAISYKIFGGSVFYGGLFGGIAIGYLALRRVPIKKADFLDVMSFGAPLFHGIARIGCFSAAVATELSLLSVLRLTVTIGLRRSMMCRAFRFSCWSRSGALLLPAS